MAAQDTTPRKILLDAGPSPRGWHRLEAFRRCPRMYAYQHLALPLDGDRVPGNGEALHRGSLVHLGLAHSNARTRAVQEKTDPDRYYTPIDAIRLAADRLRPSLRATADVLADEAIRICEGYIANYATDSLKVLYVEEVFEARIPRSGGRLGPPHRYTARVDVVVEDSKGKVYVKDYKTAARIDAGTVLSYQMSGQIVGLRFLGRQLYGDRFGGVVLDFLSTRPAGLYRRELVPASPGLDDAFIGVVQEAEERIEQIEGRALPPQAWPPAMSDQVCMTRYGQCAFLDRCRRGV